MTTYTYTVAADRPRSLGLIVLQADETIEGDFRRLVPANVQLLVSRVPSGTEVTSESLGAMEQHLTASASLFPDGMEFDAVGYGCTSGTAQIGTDRIADLVNAGTNTNAVTQPLSALIEACTTMGVNRLGMLSPYIEPVSERLREVIADNGITTPVFGTFAEPVESQVARIQESSVHEAAKKLATDAGIDALFLSCTNLHTLGVIDVLEQELGIPVFSSNQVLGWHMLRLAKATANPDAPGILFTR